MKHILLLFCILGMQNRMQASSPYLISFFIKPLSLPQLSSMDVGKKENARFRTDSFGMHLIHTGIFVAYAGVSTFSDTNGQVFLPRKTAEPRLHVFITERISPVPLTPSKQRTIVGFTTQPGTKLQHLIYTREKDLETDTYVWRVKESPWPPYKKLPYDALILFADPQALISPLGNTTTELSENFILPDFYITNEGHTALDAFHFLAVRSFLAPLSFSYSFHPQVIQKLLKASG